MNSNNQERLTLLNGCEVNSLSYEGCVYIRKDQVFRDGEIIDTLDTDEKVEELWEEYVSEEGINEDYF